MEQDEQVGDRHHQYKKGIEIRETVRSFYNHKHYIVCKCYRKVLVYNTLTRKSVCVDLNSDDFGIQIFPPYLFACFIGQFITLYSQDSLTNQEKCVNFKISKLEPICLAHYNKGYFLGGYNRSILPGQKRTTTRKLYFIDQFTSEEKNQPKFTIKLKDNEFPVSILKVQNPYLIAYCRPTFYLLSLFSHQIQLTFEKNFKDTIVLEGRYAFSNLNCLGISLKGTIFSFDIEKYPLYGVEISDHMIECQTICSDKTGRVFGCKGSSVYEYNPRKRISNCFTLYPQNEKIVWMSCSAHNSLLVLRNITKNYNMLEVFTLQ